MDHVFLDIDLSFFQNNAITALIAFIFLYLTYYFNGQFPFIKQLTDRWDAPTGNKEKSEYFRRGSGFILLGIIPALVVILFFDRSITEYGITFPSGQYAWLWFLIPTTVITVGSVFRSNKGIDLSYYPEVRRNSWNRKNSILNAVSWAFYLLGYEFSIRGMLFFACLYEFGLWPAVIINTVIYSLIHIFKGAKEAYGAIFLGVLFCLITYYTNSIWIAFLIHVLLAVINDLKAIKASQVIHKEVNEQ